MSASRTERGSLIPGCGSDWKSSIRFPEGSRRYATRPPHSGWSTGSRTTWPIKPRHVGVDVVDLEHEQGRVAGRAQLYDLALPAALEDRDPAGAGVEGGIAARLVAERIRQPERVPVEAERRLEIVDEQPRLREAHQSSLPIRSTSRHE